MKIDTDLIKEKLTSRKLWAAAVGFFIAVGAAVFCPDMDEENVKLIMSGCAALVAYIVGEGIADAGKNKKE